MENDVNKNEIIMKENINKIQQILNKINNDYADSLVDPINIDEIRKLLKVK
jgi:hypothetical protein